MTAGRLLLAAAVCAGILAAGCGRKAQERAQERLIEKAIEKQGGGSAKVSLDFEKGTFNLKTDKGEVALTSGKSAKVPESWPADVPVYKGAAVVQSLATPEGHQLVLTSKDEIAKVAGAYKRDMTAKGWASQADLNMGGQVVLTYEKDGRAATVSIGGEQGETQIMLAVAAGDKAKKTAKASKKADEDKNDKAE